MLLLLYSVIDTYLTMVFPSYIIMSHNFFVFATNENTGYTALRRL